ncbi:MAG: hypothetical protein LBQ28_00595, partial [Prevotellaceae bacterium]|nr:hypothetical protein [Prevotellaceae bacterium]
MTVNTFAAKLHNIKNAIFGVKNNPKIGKYIAFGLILLLMILGSAIVFPAVAAFLYGIALLTGLTYNEINIIVYYFVIPFSWLW